MQNDKISHFVRNDILLKLLLRHYLGAFSIKDLPSPGGLSASGGEGIKGRGRSQGE